LQIMSKLAAVIVIAVLLLPTLVEAACRCTSTTSVTGRATTVCRCPPHTTTCTSTTSVTGRITTVCR
jgi:hypothetical protein